MASNFEWKMFMVLLFASILAMSNANPNWNFGSWPYKHNGNYNNNNNNASQPKRIIVGGSQNWRYGFNYTDWAIKNGPFYLGDTLVFKYDPPNATTFAHSVYMLPSYWSFIKCDLNRGKKIADVNEGGGNGFEYVIKKWKPFYFACGQRQGLHCNNGTMKFPVFPLIHWN